MTSVLASAERGRRRLFVRDLVLACRIGVEEAERRAPQRVRINLDLAVAEGDDPPDADDPARVIRHDDLLRRARAAATLRPVRLMETLAERLAAVCLEDPRVRVARVRVEKLDGSPGAAAAGVEIERLNPAPAPPPPPAPPG